MNGQEEQRQSNVIAPALKLLQFEADIRQCDSRKALIFHLANNLQSIMAYEKAFVLEQVAKNTFTVQVVSSASVVEKSSPLIRQLTQWLRGYENRQQAHGFKTEEHLASIELPYEYCYWQPISQQTSPARYYLLLLSNEAYSENQQALLGRIADTYHHAFRALTGKQDKHIGHWWQRHIGKLISIMLLLLVLLTVPMPMSVMSAVEVVPDQPFIVTAPFNGVVKTISVAPDSAVTAGQTLLQFEDLELRNDYLLSQRKLAVAKAKYDKAQAASFVQTDYGEDANIARAELNLAIIEMQYAKQRLSQSSIESPQNGVAIYADKEKWQGKAVQVGERLLQVAQADQIHYKLFLPVAQMMSFSEQAKVTVYLDSSPLGGHQAQLVSIGYQPVVSPEGIASYILIAKPLQGGLPAIGARGTARIYGGDAPLIWHFLRRPINSARQWLGV